MIFGIDLGTTYSAIGSGDILYSDLVCSNVDTTNRKQVDRSVIGNDIVSSYKVNMTTSESGSLSVNCSSIILRELADIASAKSGEEVKDVVISVPAKFTNHQREAVKRAGEKAGLNVAHLINEPTAGAICVCRDVKDYVIVYDLGGGTFDVSVVDARTGIYTVMDTDGRLIAGDDFDRAILNDVYKELNIPIRKKSKSVNQTLLREVQKAKESLQKTNTTRIIDLSVAGLEGLYELTVDKYNELMKKTFQVTIELTNTIAKRNTTAADKPRLVFVGGSTACPYLRDWVVSETGLEEIHSDIKPEYIVARGVSIFAKMYENGETDETVEDITSTLKIENRDGTLTTIIDGGMILPAEGEIIAHNTIDTDKVHIRLYQGESGFKDGCEYIGTLEYQYEEFMLAGTGTVIISVHIDRSGTVTLKGRDILYGNEQEVKIKRA